MESGDTGPGGSAVAAGGSSSGGAALGCAGTACNGGKVGAGGTPGRGGTAGSAGTEDSAGAPSAGESAGGDGALPHGCTPNRSRCEQNAVVTCREDGGGEYVVENCGKSGAKCVASGSFARCSLTACDPGSAVCSGSIATRCKGDGSGPELEGTDCAKSSLVCDEGECRERVCTPGAKLCENGDVYVCNESGTGTRVLEECDDTYEYCDSVFATCNQLTCVPNSTWCDLGRLNACDAAGTSFTQLRDCAAHGEHCEFGACIPPDCVPGTQSCVGQKLQVCNSDGFCTHVARDCTSEGGECISTAGSAYCKVCTPAQKRCNGNYVETCDALGDGWQFEACGQDQVCKDAACVTRQCDIGLFCSGRDFWNCIDGVESTLVTKCAGNTACFIDGGLLACRRTSCDPGMPGCIFERFGVCAESGEALTTVTDDCGEKGLVCTPSGCAATVVDTIGTPTDRAEFNGARVADYIEVRSSRTLTRIEFYAALQAPAEATFEVYRNWDGWPSLEFSMTTTLSGTGFQDSGPLAAPLRARNSYYISVRIAGAFSAFASQRSEPQLTSFGLAHEAATASGIGEPLDFQTDLDHLYALRLTTAPAAP